MSVKPIKYTDVDSVVSTLCEAFYHYPVMRYVIGHNETNFDSQFASLIRLFVMARVLSNDPMFGVGELPDLAAAAVVSMPGEGTDSEALTRLRAETWASLSPAAKARYDDFCRACNQFDVDDPHHHLNMLGVRKAHQGSGYGRKLVDYVIEMSAADDLSLGVSLSTESPSNVPFYQHLGFEMTGHAVVGPGLETWNFFRPKI